MAEVLGASDVIAKIMSHVKISDIQHPVLKTPCWEWQRSAHPFGYGQIYINGKLQRVHRLMFSLANSGISPGLFVLHRCDNPRCCNPSHLFEGTQKDNIADCKAKERNAKGDRVGTRKYPERYVWGKGAITHPERIPRGEKHGMAKITAAQAEEIKSLKGKMSQQKIADLFGISQTHVGRIHRGVRWKEFVPADSPAS